MNNYLDEYRRKIPLYNELMDQTQRTLHKILEEEGLPYFPSMDALKLPSH